MGNLNTFVAVEGGGLEELKSFLHSALLQMSKDTIEAVKVERLSMDCHDSYRMDCVACQFNNGHVLTIEEANRLATAWLKE